MDNLDLTVPELLNVPDKLYPVIDDLNKYRYFLIEGGRGGGKSQGIGRFLLYLAEKYPLRIVCGREIQKSITESVYSLLADLINQFNLNFEILASKITHRKRETAINFRGFRELGAFNIQGMEGVDIVWIDEAQSITKQTLDVLIPTIRKEHAKIFFTMNRHVEDDPVFEFLKDRKDCLHININYDENQFCTEALKREAAECKIKSESDYLHIWKGIPLGRAEDALFSVEELLGAKDNHYSLREGYGKSIGGFDVARYGGDKCTCVKITQMGALHWGVTFVDQWEHRDLNYTTGRILTISNEERLDQSIIDEDGIGSGPLDTLNKGRGLNNFVGFKNPPINYKDNKEFGNVRTKYAYEVKKMILEGHLYFTDADLIKELRTLRFDYDNYQRKLLVSKKRMREKYKIKSPNLADGLIMAVSLIGEIKQEQDVQYFKEPAYSKEESLC